MAIGEPVDWRMDLGGGVSVALVQAGVFTSDAGTIFGPVPRILWERLVADEINPDMTLTQALNCLLIETPAGRVLVETGAGERLGERKAAQRGVAGPWIVPALEAAGFEASSVDVVALSHLHWDHAGGLLRADGGAAFPRARIAAQADEWEFALGSNPRLQASYEQDELRLVEGLGRQGAARGDEELLPGVSVMRAGGHTGGSQAVVVRAPRGGSSGAGRSGGASDIGRSAGSSGPGRSGVVAFFGDLCMRPWSANPRWVPSFDDFPLTSVEVKGSLFRQAVEEDWTIVLSHEPRTPVGRLTVDRDRFRFTSIL
ncbi:MAG TPA: MBL fold metallo-hydrolase [Candidatus Limnocylindrales bacterium]|nr:MBL fold metallo-hydrolase [Candidatus Limnocylindrales bacterium]